MEKKKPKSFPQEKISVSEKKFKEIQEEIEMKKAQELKKTKEERDQQENQKEKDELLQCRQYINSLRNDIDELDSVQNTTKSLFSRH